MALVPKRLVLIPSSRRRFPRPACGAVKVGAD